MQAYTATMDNMITDEQKDVLPANGNKIDEKPPAGL
jgi:hypothetical protein